MSKYMDQGCKTRTLDSSVTAPCGDRGGSKILENAKGSTVGIVGDKGIAKGGLPVGKGGK